MSEKKMREKEKGRKGERRGEGRRRKTEKTRFYLYMFVIYSA